MGVKLLNECGRQDGDSSSHILTEDIGVGRECHCDTFSQSMTHAPDWSSEACSEYLRVSRKARNPGIEDSIPSLCLHANMESGMSTPTMRSKITLVQNHITELSSGAGGWEILNLSLDRNWTLKADEST